MRSIVPFVVAGVLCVLAFLPSRAEAQPAGWESVDVRFGGGQLEDYVEELRKATRGSDSGPLNVVWSGDAAKQYPVDAIELQNVSIDTAIQVVLPTQGVWFAKSGKQYMVEFEKLQSNLQASPVYSISVREAPQDPFENATRIEIFSMAELASGDQAIDDIAGAIRAAIELGDEENRAEMRYHPETSLLIVRGTGAQIVTVESLLSSAKRSVNFRSNESRAIKSDLSNVRQEIVVLEGEIERARAELEIGRLRLDKMQEQVKGGYVSEDQLLGKEVELRTAMVSLQTLERKLLLVRDRARELEAELNSATETLAYGITGTGRRALAVLKEVASISGEIRGAELESGRDTELIVAATARGHEAVREILVQMQVLGSGNLR
ncbi:MAG: hypothetical protein AAGI17_03540 [Planctomycetota bacterium]